MSPATSWAEMQVDPAGYMDSIPSPAPRTAGGTITEDYFVDWLMEYGLTFVPFFPPEPPGAWTEQSVAATSHTELTVGATAWTELT